MTIKKISIQLIDFLLDGVVRKWGRVATCWKPSIWMLFVGLCACCSIGESDCKTSTKNESSGCREKTEAADARRFDCDWVTIEGGSYRMGSAAGLAKEPNEYPQHPVKVPTFRIWRTENTVAQYLACVKSGWCTPTLIKDYQCNADFPKKRASYPINCIDWSQARDFCHWLGGRLPTEAEWEFAARNRGKNVLYPWGNTEPTCELAVMDVKAFDPTHIGPAGCDGIDTTQPVCSKPRGNTAEGLCDIVGNVYEWTEDWFHISYAYTSQDGVAHSAPTDGSAWIDSPDPKLLRIMRGGGIGSPKVYRTTCRQPHDGHFAYGGLGVRCAKDVEP